MSGKVIPLKKQEPAAPESSEPWNLGEVVRRGQVDYELVTAAEITALEWKRVTKVGEQSDTACSEFSGLLSRAGAMAGDQILVLRRIRVSAPAPRLRRRWSKKSGPSSSGRRQVKRFVRRFFSEHRRVRNPG
jgi:hypothetical protein